MILLNRLPILFRFFTQLLRLNNSDAFTKAKYFSLELAFEYYINSHFYSFSGFRHNLLCVMKWFRDNIGALLIPLPTEELVVDYFRWRAEDASRNALNAGYYWTMRKNGASVAEATKKFYTVEVDKANRFTII